MIPVLLGRRLPDRAALELADDQKNDPQLADDKKRYAMCALLMFVPFRSARDLCVDGDWWKAYVAARDAGLFGKWQRVLDGIQVLSS